MLWNRISGMLTLRIVSPEPERLLDALVGSGLVIWNVTQPEELTFELSIPRTSWKDTKALIHKFGGKYRIRYISGFTYILKKWCCRPLLITAVCIVLLGGWVISGTVLSVKVEGNQRVPDMLILDAAESLGLGFGAGTRRLRSEELKNKMLQILPELEWIGVNTSGCTAVISVRERQTEENVPVRLPCNIISAADGIVDEVAVNTGTLLCAPGQAVKQGQVLVSGLQDLGSCTRAVIADAEIYGLTLRENFCVFPIKMLSAEEKGTCSRKISLIIGKKRINLYSDSGILMPSCGKMTEIKKLCLFDSLTLPAAVQIETYYTRQLKDKTLNAEAACSYLQQAATSAVEQEMTAGTICRAQVLLEESNGIYRLHTAFQCRELIGIQKSIAIWEGETDDE